MKKIIASLMMVLLVFGSVGYTKAQTSDYEIPVIEYKTNLIAASKGEETMVVNPLVEDSRALSPSNPVFTAKRSDVVSPMETVGIHSIRRQPTVRMHSITH